ncbi:hypothetical protein [Reyranella soli]|uniref:Uncharacterized protein n=1 Tax=Reyranella soli TaxID=1230389 RepID=A0A512NNV6_9HYPH|nr:hypothetical protein [Reyranella soli]GEP60630.1 hypothetical protein RSO01_77960 [Reyranella soli]
MGRRKGEDTIAARRRRMPYVAKMRREDPFKPEDAREVEAACRRVAAASEFMVLAGWREDSGYRIYHFTTWAKARAMQHWIDRSGIANRPMPKLGLTSEEIAEAKRRALEWGVRTGAVRDVVQAYRQARYSGDAELTSFNAACNVAAALGRSGGEVENTVRTLLDWARASYPDWFSRCEPVAEANPRPKAGQPRHALPVLDDEWPPSTPRLGPTF